MNALDQLETALRDIRALTRGSAFEASLAELNTTLVALLSEREQDDPAKREREARELAASEGIAASLAALLEMKRQDHAQDMEGDTEKRAEHGRMLKAVESLAASMAAQKAPQVVVQLDVKELAAAIVQGLSQRQPVTVTKDTDRGGKTVYQINRSAA